jgi:uncharacterized membrane protein
MNKIVFYVFLTLVSLLFLYGGLTRFTGFFVGFGPPEKEFEWWNVSWHYRFKLEINTTEYNRTDWPIEYKVNFTDLFPLGTFDENSIRLIEYNSSGSILYEVPSQFDKDENFDTSNNAIGTLVFLMNGTTEPNTKRIFFVYYDKTESGIKDQASYSTNLTYWNGTEEFNVNNSLLAFWTDTLRGENTSGLIRVRDLKTTPNQDIFQWPLADDVKTYEYVQFSNGSYNFTYNFTSDLVNNEIFKYTGPIRIVTEQKGYENIWNSTNSTNEGFMVKRYTFYDKLKWIKLEINFTNIGSYEIYRNSTFAGALGLDASRAFGVSWQSNFGNTTEPGWWYAADFYNDRQFGVIHVNQSGTTNFWIPNSSQTNRTGIQLNLTNIAAGNSITETAVFRFSYQEYYQKIEDLRNRLANPVIITQSLPEQWYVSIEPTTNTTVYNRNETVLIIGNVSVGDPYNFTKYMNATLDMGTPSTVDDQTIVLYDDGTNGDSLANDKVFTNTFEILNDAQQGIWAINFTAYENNSEFLNSTAFAFNVTDVLNVTVNITNKKPIISSIVIANIQVKNYRQDGWISGATINCSFDSSEVTNKTDYNNGTYSVNFTAPSEEESYNLYCNATKNGNFGNDTDTFTTEPAKTNISIITQPSNPSVYNITLYSNDSFTITTNATNVGNGTAYLANITLELLNGWTADQNLKECGDINKNSYCLKDFNITVPNNTSPGNYYINVTVIWKNPDEATFLNKTEVNVTVASNPLINVSEAEVYGETGDGIWTVVGNFTVISIGNDQLTNITFSCVSGDVCNDFNTSFIPENISNLPVGLNQSVLINVTVPLSYPAGTYNGTINVSAQNDNFDTFTLRAIVPSKTNVSITRNISTYIANNITQQDNQTFSFITNATNIKNGTAKFVNISLILPSGWFSSSSLEGCGNLTKNTICSKEFNITIPKATTPGNYLVNVFANWTQPDNSLGTNQTSITVTVASNPLINVSETNVSGYASDASEVTIGNFTVLSIGNDALQNVNFNCSSGEVCQNFTVKFIPTSISSIPANSNQSVSINVTVFLSYPAGIYNGTINVSAQNDNFDTFNLEVTVLENRTWELSPTYCERSTQQPVGTACEINVTNKGNTQINFTVSPEQGNYAMVNETSFVVNRSSWHVFNVTYDTTTAPPGSHNSTFLVDAVQSGANPDNISFNVSLIPFIPPILSAYIAPNDTEQNTSIKILANVTDRSGSNITWTKINITRPDGTIDALNMFLLETNGNLTRWELTYPNGTNGTTVGRGIYNVTVYTRDNIGNEENYNSSFLIYIKLSTVLSTLSNSYYQGDTGSIYYIARNLTNAPLSNITINFTVNDPQGNITYLSSNIQTNSDGAVVPLPTFSLSSDAPLGNYSLTSFSKYYDSISNKSLEIQNNYSFQLFSRTVSVTGLFADIETAVVWYPPLPGYDTPRIRFGILTYNGEGRPVDPDSINLTLYRPDGVLYLTDSMSSMQKQLTGYYTYDRLMLDYTPTGMYLAAVNVTQGQFQTLKLKAFRVARGGPYDVIITPLENEVEQASYLDFLLTIENKGEVSQDVIITYWTSSGNDTYFSRTEEILTPALYNQTVTKRAYINSTQPLGNYFLNLRVIYDNVQPPIIVNSSFFVVAKVTPTPPPPVVVPSYVYVPGGVPIYMPSGAALLPTPTEKTLANIFISRYNSNISLSRGFTKIESVVVNNTGQVNLNNVSLVLVGIPTTWFNITPVTYKTLDKGNSTVFIITFNIPKNVKVDEYAATMIATSGVVSDQKTVAINIFESIEDLLKQDIKKLKEDLQNLQVDTKIAEKEGKDVSSVLIIIDEIKSQINLAEENLANKKTEEALGNIANAKNLVERARDLLNKLEIIRMRLLLPPWWVILIIIIIIAVVGFVVYIWWKKKKIAELRPWIIPIGKIVDMVKGKKLGKEEMIKEREKLLRMLEVLENERKDGMISVGAYKEMKKSIEKKLSEIEGKIY